MMRQNGYKLHARMIWDKGNGIAPAFTIRYSHEYLLWFYKPKLPLIDKNFRGKYKTVFYESSREHSRKPNFAYTMIENLYPNSVYMDVFSREKRDKWLSSAIRKITLMIPILEISNDDYLQVNQWIPEEIKLHEKRGNLYYCRLNLVPLILDKIAKKKEPVVLITDNGDITLSKIEDTYYCHTSYNCDAQFDKTNMTKYVQKWFSTSLNVCEDGFQLLPLGILPLHYEILKEIAKKHTDIDRDNLLYSNFGPTSNLRRNLISKMYGHYIDSIPLKFMEFAKVEWPPQVQWPEYGNFLRGYAFNLLTSKFCLCPPGVGVDTYRLWECLYMGCIPILLNTPFVENLKNYRISVVDSYEDVTQEFLNQEYDRISNIDYDVKLLCSRTYRNLINVF